MKEYDWLIGMLLLIIFAGGCVIGCVISGASVIIIQFLIKLATS